MLDMTWKEFKTESRRRYLMRLLIRSKCCVSEAARMADMNRTDFYKQVIRFKIDLKVLAARLLEIEGEDESIRRRLRRKLIIPDWDRPIPGYQPFTPKQKNNNVRT